MHGLSLPIGGRGSRLGCAMPLPERGDDEIPHQRGDDEPEHSQCIASSL
jgi:hypothetical protein